MSIADKHAFILQNTAVMAPPHVPEIKLHLADEAHALWQKTEDELGTLGLEPPFWAFAWAGGQALARYVLDHPALVTGKRVFDLASGSGLVAIAAAKAGAVHVTANDVDPFCAEAIGLNADVNDVQIEPDIANRIGDPLSDHEVTVAGDVFYDRAMADALVPWFSALSRAGKTVIIGDPGRHYLPRNHLERLQTYTVPVTRALEDAEVKKSSVWRFAA